MIGQGFLTKIKDILFSPKIDTSTSIATCDNITIEEAEYKMSLAKLKRTIDSMPLAEPFIHNEYGDKTLLIVNDIPSVLKLLELDFQKLKTMYHKDIFSNYKIVICSGKYSNLIAYKYISDNKIDIAFVDIILSDSIIKIKDDYIEFNGLNLSEEIVKYSPNAEVNILTSEPLTNSMGLVKGYTSLLNRLKENSVIKDLIPVDNQNRLFKLNSIL